MKKLIWHNDACETYDSIMENYEDYMGEPKPEKVDENKVWDEAYEEIKRTLDDEESNLDIEKNHPIILIGTLEKWFGPRSAYKELNTNNIGKAIREATMSFGNQENTFQVYVENGKMLISQLGHDNPVNPAIMEFRVLKDANSIDELDDDKIETIMRHSESLASDCCKVYGW